MLLTHLLESTFRKYGLSNAVVSIILKYFPDKPEVDVSTITEPVDVIVVGELAIPYPEPTLVTPPVPPPILSLYWNLKTLLILPYTLSLLLFKLSMYWPDAVPPPPVKRKVSLVPSDLDI